MKKLFGIEMEFNFTADEDVMKGIGKGNRETKIQKWKTRPCNQE